jgi:hypothetical protein
MTTAHDFTGSVAYSYARFSDITQQGGHSLERQQGYAPEFCEEFGCKLNTTLRFTDLGKSAFHGRHIVEGGGLHRFRECIDAGLVKEGDILIVENLDRVSRLPLDEAEDLLKSILSTGVRIHTRSPWSIYDRDTLRDPLQRMQMIFEFTRSYRESKYKQERLSRRWAKNRDKARRGEYKLAITPGWLRAVRVGEKVQRFELVTSRVEVVRRVYQLCLDGVGLFGICKILNSDKVPTFGGGEFWCRSSIFKLLHNRATLGEYQPFTTVRIEGPRIDSVKRAPQGEAIEDYYPAIIDRKTFDAAQLALSKRKERRTGAGGLKVTNLFSGMLTDARDGSAVGVIDKGYGPRLASNREIHTSGSSIYVPYKLLEDAFSVYVNEMPLELVKPKNRAAIDKTISGIRKEVEALELQVKKIRTKTRSSNSDVLLDLLIERDTELKEKRQELETLERQRGDSATIAAKTTKELLQAIRQADEVQLLKLRTKLRSELRYWIRRIHVLPLRLGKARALMATVELSNGETLELRAAETLVDWPSELDGLSAREFKKWGSKARKIKWDMESEFDKKVRQMHAQGLTFAETASALNSTVSVVSKRALAMGLRKMSVRRKFTPERQMNWHPSGNGWVRSRGGKRYFVGCRNLKKLYPKLVTSLDEAGTEKAATRWWVDNFGS